MNQGGFKMLDIEKLDNELYGACYRIPKKENAEEIWNKIKNNKEILREAVKVIRNKWNNGDLVKGLTICEAMLIDYGNVDQIAYNQLIQAIYTNSDIARIVLDGASNGGFSYLLMSLWNHNIKLTEEQKAFAVDEAMNKIGTIKSQKAKKEYIKKLEEQGITNDITTMIDIDGYINPIGAKSKNVYFYDTLNMLDTTQAHGTGEFDIRYQILRNPNWTVEEKQKLIMDFWADDETYDETLEQWEWGVANDSANYKGEVLPQFDKFEMYEYSYEELLQFYGDKKTTDRIWEEIQFCKQMHQLRPQQWELESSKIKQLV